MSPGLHQQGWRMSTTAPPPWLRTLSSGRGRGLQSKFPLGVAITSGKRRTRLVKHCILPWGLRRRAEAQMMVRAWFSRGALLRLVNFFSLVGADSFRWSHNYVSADAVSAHVVMALCAWRTCLNPTNGLPELTGHVVRVRCTGRRGGGEEPCAHMQMGDVDGV